jgi:hypothetical protein
MRLQIAGGSFRGPIQISLLNGIFGDPRGLILSTIHDSGMSGADCLFPLFSVESGFRGQATDELIPREVRY